MNNKQLLQKYVDTGVLLPEYQVRSLPDNLKNTYIRKRLIAVEQTGRGLEDYEFVLLTQEQMGQYAMKMAGNGLYGRPISYGQFELLEPDQRFQYAMKRVEKVEGISDDQFELLTPDQRFQWAMKRVEKNWRISDYKFKLLTPGQRFQWATKWIVSVSYEQFKLLTPKQRFKYVMKLKERGLEIAEYHFELLTPEQQKIFIDNGGEVY